MNVLRTNSLSAEAELRTGGRLPNFLIIGAARSGTTTLHYVLGQHPQIYMSPNKETNYFSFYCSDGAVPIVTRKEDVRVIDQRSVKTLDEYCMQFRGVVNEIAIGESSPSYLLMPDVPATIQRMIPDAKIIAILRQPIDKAYSHYLRKVQTNIYSLADDFGEVLEMDNARVAREGRGASFLAHCQYSECLKRYYDMFDRDRIKVCLFDDMEQRPAEFYADLFTFLGVDPTFVPDSRTKYNQSVLEKQNPILYKLMVRLELRRRAIKHLPPRMAQSAFRLGHRLLSASVKRPPSLSDEARRELTQRYFADEIRRLEALIGRDLSHWLR